VLVIDDEPNICKTLARILGAAHDVVTEVDPEAALRLLLGGERFDVVFCDVMMPCVDGMEVHRRVAEAQPSTAERFVFMTGGIFTEVAADFLAHLPNPTVDKPFDSARIRDLVRLFLEGPRRSPR
jgi:CheY-like chemotaxis protein